MFSQLVSFIALATLLVPVPSRAVPGAAWVRRQEDAQSSFTLDPAVISHGLEQDGQGDNPDPGQVRSLTSSNNFINFCLPFLDQGVVLTNGAQVIAGSCNQTPMGRIISLDLAPRSKFVFPPNGDESISPNTAFTVKMKLLNMEAGNFVNAQTNYYAAPQQVNGQGVLIGHTHFVIEPLPSLDTTEPLDPLKFAFFKGINNPVDGDNIVQTSVTAGLAAGFYRLCSINTAANHQPALVSNAQHGALDDCSYFTIKEQNGNNNASTTEAASATDSVSATDSASASASTSDAASTTETATDVATDAPQATQSTDGSASASSTDDAQSSTTATPDSTTNTDAAAPTETSSADNGNGNQSGNNDNNNGNQGGNNGNTDGNNGGNNGNSDANNGGNNQNAPSDNSASAPASTDATPSDNTPTDAAPSDNAPTDAAPSDNAPTDAAPSNNAPTDAVPSDNTPTDAAPTDNATPTDDSSAAPAPTDATPSDAPSQGNNTGADNGNNSNNDNQGGNDPATTA